MVAGTRAAFDGQPDPSRTVSPNPSRTVSRNSSRNHHQSRNPSRNPSRNVSPGPDGGRRLSPDPARFAAPRSPPLLDDLRDTRLDMEDELKAFDLKLQDYKHKSHDLAPTETVAETAARIAYTDGIGMISRNYGGSNCPGPPSDAEKIRAKVRESETGNTQDGWEDANITKEKLSQNIGRDIVKGVELFCKGKHDEACDYFTSAIMSEEVHNLSSPLLLDTTPHPLSNLSMASMPNLRQKNVSQSTPVEVNLGMMRKKGQVPIRIREQAFINLAYSKLASGEISNATKDAEKAVTINPRSVRAYRCLGAIYLETSENVLAAECFIKSLELQVNDPLSTKQLGHALNRIRNAHKCETRGIDGTYPIVHKISPREGSVLGGTDVLIEGICLGEMLGREDKSPVQVFFGKQRSPKVICLSKRKLLATAPQCASFLEGAVNVVVRRGQSTSRARPGLSFTFARPKIVSVTPSQCPVEGGQQITVSGKFLGTDESHISIKVGSRECTNVKVIQAHKKVACTVPAGEKDNSRVFVIAFVTSANVLNIGSVPISSHGSSEFTYGGENGAYVKIHVTEFGPQAPKKILDTVPGLSFNFQRLLDLYIPTENLGDLSRSEVHTQTAGRMMEFVLDHYKTLRRIFFNYTLFGSQEFEANSLGITFPQFSSFLMDCRLISCVESDVTTLVDAPLGINMDDISEDLETINKLRVIERRCMREANRIFLEARGETAESLGSEFSPALVFEEFLVATIHCLAATFGPRMPKEEVLLTSMSQGLLDVVMPLAHSVSNQEVFLAKMCSKECQEVIRKFTRRTIILVQIYGDKEFGGDGHEKTTVSYSSFCRFLNDHFLNLKESIAGLEAGLTQEQGMYAFLYASMGRWVLRGCKCNPICVCSTAYRRETVTHPPAIVQSSYNEPQFALDSDQFQEALVRVALYYAGLPKIEQYEEWTGITPDQNLPVIIEYFFRGTLDPNSKVDTLAENVQNLHKQRALESEAAQGSGEPPPWMLLVGLPRRRRSSIGMVSQALLEDIMID